MTLGADHLSALTRAQQAAGQPAPQFDRFAEICKELFGFKLLTVFAWAPERDEVLRVFSSDHTPYPVGRWKPMGPTPWGAKVLKAGETVLVRTLEEMRWAYPDNELLLRLDCIASMSAPIIHDGRVLGSSSINDSAGAYTAEQVADFALLVQSLSPALLTQPIPA